MLIRKQFSLLLSVLVPEVPVYLWPPNVPLFPERLLGALLPNERLPPDDLLSNDLLLPDGLFPNERLPPDDLLSNDLLLPDELLPKERLPPDGLLSNDLLLLDELFPNERLPPDGVEYLISLSRLGVEDHLFELSLEREPPNPRLFSLRVTVLRVELSRLLSLK